VVVVGHGDGRVTVRDINTGATDEGRVEVEPGRNIFADGDV
jgi:ribose 5-phosphate isomerase A